ncbi:hypothetical protein [Halosimplex salinum]|uniref:hypothetical protein n=1 Tax=Halosimplex salinum TaxID=1710538 RepID=UPI0019D01FCE|nr:hypothetical protein [Halosimplex salinum]
MTGTESAEGHDGALGAVESVGTYVPRSTISAETVREAWDGFHARGVSEKRVPAADEDAVTMAVAAARNALDDSEHNRDDVETLALGTTTPPVDEGDIGATVAEVVGLGEGTEVSVHSQSTRAGTRAVVDGLRSGTPALVVAADAPRGSPDDAVDHAAGAGAVALVVADDGDAAVTDHATYTREFPGTRFRRRGNDEVETYGATTYEREAYTTTVTEAVDALDADFEALAPTAPDGSRPGRAGRAVEGSEVFQLAGELGDTGAASPLFGLVAAWDAGSESVAVVGYGDGASADALAIRGSIPVKTAWPSVEITYPQYLRQRGHVGGED